jgi:hypothetical protein
MSKPKYNFEKIDKAFIEKEFGLKRVKQSVPLSAWINAKVATDEKDFALINHLRLLLEDRLEDVNEETLKMNYISFILSLIQFNGKNYTAFADEKIEAEFDTMILTGKVDWFVAKGKYKPETPYLFMQEYKRSKRAQSDPEGQLLAEMLSARKLNNTEEPMKGVSITGKFWNFVILDGNQYCISKSYDSTQEEELKDIYGILKVAKNEIAKRLD